MQKVFCMLRAPERGKSRLAPVPVAEMQAQLHQVRVDVDVGGQHAQRGAPCADCYIKALGDGRDAHARTAWSKKSASLSALPRLLKAPR